MSKFEKRLIQAAKEAVAFARGELAPGSYRVHTPDDDADVAAPLRHVKIFHKAGPGRMAHSARKAHKHPMMVRRKKK